MKNAHLWLYELRFTNKNQRLFEINCLKNHRFPASIIDIFPITDYISEKWLFKVLDINNLSIKKEFYIKNQQRKFEGRGCFNKTGIIIDICTIRKQFMSRNVFHIIVFIFEIVFYNITNKWYILDWHLASTILAHN